MNYNILSKDIVKYLVVIGIIYTILKLMPSQKLSNKDIMLLLLIIIIIFVTIDYKCFKNDVESFVSTSTPNSTPTLTSTPTKDKKESFINKEYQNLVGKLLNLTKPNTEQQIEQISEKNITTEEITQLLNDFKKSQNQNNDIEQKPKIVDQKPQTVPSTGCSLEIDKIKQDMQNQINVLKNELINNNTNNNTNVGQKYFDSLMIELKNNNIITDSDIQNIKNKISLKLLTLEEVIVSLEKLKDTKKDVQPITDLKYNELPSGFYTPIGDKIANDWDNDYNILDTTKWTVPMPRPPVCINNSPCKVCPSNTLDTLNLKDWDNSRIISNTSINKKWINNQTN